MQARTRQNPIAAASFADIEDLLVAPIGSQEVWASGVTYYRSRNARMEEAKTAGGGDFYDRVYLAERPELFMKATPNRVVGHRGRVAIRKDATWSVPEPELTLLASPGGKILGYTIGNDMSSRDIEGKILCTCRKPRSMTEAVRSVPGYSSAESRFLPQPKFTCRSCAPEKLFLPVRPPSPN